jgi:hypothetical protein
MSGKKPILLNLNWKPGDPYFVPMATDGPSPIGKAFAAAVKEVRRKRARLRFTFHTSRRTPRRRRSRVSAGARSRLRESILSSASSRPHTEEASHGTTDDRHRSWQDSISSCWPYPRDEIVVRKKFSRKQLLHFTANLRVELISMEACGGSHFLAAPYRSRGMKFG